MRYALHVALINEDKEEVERRLEFTDSVQEVHVDGDSFLEWGEFPNRAGYWHCVIVFETGYDQPTEYIASQTAMEILLPLLQEPNVVSLNASCSFSEHVPWAITDPDDWSLGIGVTA